MSDLVTRLRGYADAGARHQDVLQRDCAAAADEIERLTDERDEAVALLRELEWCVIDVMQNQHCPICGRFKGAHRKGCRLDALLAGGGK